LLDAQEVEERDSRQGQPDQSPGGLNHLGQFGRRLRGTGLSDLVYHFGSLPKLQFVMRAGSSASVAAI